jgi:hypothetical protein
MPSEPTFKGIVYRSRINDKINLSDSDGPATIAEINTQYKNVGAVDEIQSRTFDEDHHDPYGYFGYTDFSNTINTMDENHWLQVDSDGYGNNILGDELDFRPERPGREQPPAYSIGLSILSSSLSSSSGTATHIFNISSDLESTTASLINAIIQRTVNSLSAEMSSGLSASSGDAERIIISSGDVLSSGLSTSSGVAKRIIISSGDVLYSNISTVIAETILNPRHTIDTGTVGDLSSMSSGHSTFKSNDPNFYVLMTYVGGTSVLQEYVDDVVEPPDLSSEGGKEYVLKIGDGSFTINTGIVGELSSMSSDVAKFYNDPPSVQEFRDPDLAARFPHNDNGKMFLLTPDPTMRHYANYFNTECWSYDGRYICLNKFPTDYGSFSSEKPQRQIRVVDLYNKGGTEIFVGNGIDPRWAKTSNTLFYSHYTEITEDDNGDRVFTFTTTSPSGIDIKKYDADTDTLTTIGHGVENLGECNRDDTVLYGVQRYRPAQRVVIGPNNPAPEKLEEYYAVRLLTDGSGTVTMLAPDTDGVRGTSPGARRPIPNRFYDIVLMRNKKRVDEYVNNRTYRRSQRGDFPFERSRSWFTESDTNLPLTLEVASVLQFTGHPNWTGDGEYMVLGNSQLNGRKYNEPYPSNIELLANNRVSDPGAAGPSGRWMVSKGRVIDIRAGSSRVVSSPRTRIIYPLLTTGGTNNGDKSEEWDADGKGSPDGTKVCFVSNFDIRNGKTIRSASTLGLGGGNGTFLRGNLDKYPDGTTLKSLGWPDPTEAIDPSTGNLYVDGIDPSTGKKVEYDLTKDTEVIGYNSLNGDAFMNLNRGKYGTRKGGVAIGEIINDLTSRILTEEEIKYRYGIPNHMLKSGDYQPFPPNLPGFIGSGPLLNQRQTDAYFAVVRLPDPPYFRAKVSGGYELIPGENSLEIKGYHFYKDGNVIVDASNDPILYLAGTTYSISTTGTYYATAVENGNLEGIPSNNINITASTNLEVLSSTPADFSWTTEVWTTSAGNVVTESEALQTETSYKTITSKYEYQDFDTTQLDQFGNELEQGLIKKCKYTNGLIEYEYDYDHNGIVSRMQLYKMKSTNDASYLKYRAYYEKDDIYIADANFLLKYPTYPTNAIDEPIFVEGRTPLYPKIGVDIVSREYYNEQGVKVRETRWSKETNVAGSGTKQRWPRSIFGSTVFYSDGNNIQLDEAGNADPNLAAPLPAMTPVGQRSQTDKFYHRRERDIFSTPGDFTNVEDASWIAYTVPDIDLEAEDYKSIWMPDSVVYPFDD